MTYLCPSPDTVITNTDHYYVHEVYKTGILPVHGVFPTVDVSGLHLSGFHYHFPYVVSVLYPELAVSPVVFCCPRYPAPYLEHQLTSAKIEAMEEAKLIRMAAAISEYTISSMLRETVHCRRYRNLRNPWVSVQDVVLNSLEPSTLPSQPLPELSHFYQTHKHRNISCSCRYGSCWCVTP